MKYIFVSYRDKTSKITVLSKVTLLVLSDILRNKFDIPNHAEIILRDYIDNKITKDSMLRSLGKYKMFVLWKVDEWERSSSKGIAINVDNGSVVLAPGGGLSSVSTPIMKMGSQWTYRIYFRNCSGLYTNVGFFVEGQKIELSRRFHSTLCPRITEGYGSSGDSFTIKVVLELREGTKKGIYYLDTRGTCQAFVPLFGRKPSEEKPWFFSFWTKVAEKVELFDSMKDTNEIVEPSGNICKSANMENYFIGMPKN